MEMDQGPYPRIRFFEGDGQKNGEELLWVIPPEFAEQLHDSGFATSRESFQNEHRAIRIISRIGKATRIM